MNKPSTQNGTKQQPRVQPHAIIAKQANHVPRPLLCLTLVVTDA